MEKPLKLERNTQFLFLISQYSSLTITIGNVAIYIVHVQNDYKILTITNDIQITKHN